MSFDPKKTHNRMMATYLIVSVVAFVGILIMLIRIQGVQGEKWREVSIPREVSLRMDPAQRGTIRSSDGQILAVTMPVCDLYLDLAKKAVRNNGKLCIDSYGDTLFKPSITDSLYECGVGEVAAILGRASKLRDHDSAYYYHRIDSERRKNDFRGRKGSGCMLVQGGLPYSSWDSICQVKGWNSIVVKSIDTTSAATRKAHPEKVFPLMSVVRDVRAHIYGNMAENTIGFYSRAGVSTGLEGFYDDTLSGQDGMSVCRRLTRGVWIEENKMGHLLSEKDDTVYVDLGPEVERRDGVDIISTIDTRFQDIAQSSLRSALSRYGAESGCAVLMEMSTGYVLACSNLTLDTSNGMYYEMVDRNIACSDVYEPGSTFKPVILTAMMNDTTIALDTNERVRIGYKTFSQYSGEITDGSKAERDTVNVARALAKSSNVGMCELGWKYYKDRRSELVRLVEEIFPYKALQLDIKANEVNGHINKLGPDRDFLNFCYGYANSVSVMQMLTFYNALGAGGRMVKPQFCRGMIIGNEVRENKPIVMKEQICSPQTANIMRDMLVGVVEHGTGNNIKNNVYGIAGKTGTAVYNYKNMHRYTASFAGFFPAESPKYSCIVVVKSVAAHGRQAAAPVFKKIADCVVAIDKELGFVKLKDSFVATEDLTAGHLMPLATKVRRSKASQAYVGMGIDTSSLLPKSEWLVWNVEQDSTGVHEGYEAYELPMGVVPNCMGMTAREAIALLQEMGLKVRISGYGRVVSQYPRFGTKCEEGNVVTLKLK